MPDIRIKGVPWELWSRVTALCVLKGIKKQDLVKELLARWLEEQKEGKR